MMQKLNPKDLVFSIVLAVVALAILNRIVPPSVDPVVKLVISKNRAPIHNIHQVRDVELTREIMVDELNLSNKNQFRHPELGAIGYADRFFVDVDEEFKVKRAGQYIFAIGSDDGFVAKINGDTICEFPSDRPFAIQRCRVNLPAGVHRFQLSYFQGYGNAGLSVQYMKSASDKMRYFGDSSKYIDFD